MRRCKGDRGQWREQHLSWAFSTICVGRSLSFLKASSHFFVLMYWRGHWRTKTGTKLQFWQKSNWWCPETAYLCDISMRTERKIHFWSSLLLCSSPEWTALRAFMSSDWVFSSSKIPPEIQLWLQRHEIKAGMRPWIQQTRLASSHFYRLVNFVSVREALFEIE